MVTITYEEVFSWLRTLRNGGIAVATPEIQGAATAAHGGSRCYCSETSLSSNSPFAIALLMPS